MKKFTKIDSIKLNESWDPNKPFTKTIEMTRAEIAKDLSIVIGQEVNPLDDRLTDDFCETWINIDSGFLEEMSDDDLKKKLDKWVKSLAQKANFEIIEKDKGVIKES
jgi:hypothetical protein